jgi:hypothetical protein
MEVIKDFAFFITLATSLLYFIRFSLSLSLSLCTHKVRFIFLIRYFYKCKHISRTVYMLSVKFDEENTVFYNSIYAIQNGDNIGLLEVDLRS